MVVCRKLDGVFNFCICFLYFVPGLKNIDLVVAVSYLAVAGDTVVVGHTLVVGYHVGSPRNVPFSRLLCNFAGGFGYRSIAAVYHVVLCPIALASLRCRCHPGDFISLECAS